MITNKIALVTGASRGIGKGIALSLARKGTDVILTYRSQHTEAESVVAQIKALGRKAAALPLNAADTSSFDAFSKQLASILKNTFDADHFDFLINNAGIYQYEPIEEVSAETFHQQFNINVWGALLTIQASLKLFGDTGGNIINISSEAGKRHLPTGSVYSATKAALDAITTSLSKEFSKKISVSTLFFPAL